MHKIKRSVLLVALVLIADVTMATSPPEDEVVLIRQQDITVTRADFNAEIRRIPPNYRGEVLASRTRLAQILDGLVLNRALAVAARKAGYDKKPEVMNEVKLAEDRVLGGRYLDDRVANVSLPNFETRALELYKLSPDKYTIKPEVDVSHILVSIKDGKKEEALDQANSLRKKLIEGADFEALAEAHSDDGSAKKNKGRLGFVTPEKVVKEFADAAFALGGVGDISKPVESKFGFHIIKLQAKKPGGMQDFASVREGIVEGLKTEYLANKRKEIINSVRGAGELQINEAEIDKLKTILPYPAKVEDNATVKTK